jgi:hypothetical protein
MSTLRVNTIQNVAGSGTPAINGLAQAWVNFNGTGTVAIRASFNVTSITDNGTGLYTVNFTTAFADANYSVVGSAIGTTSAYNNYVCGNGLALQTGNCQVKTFQSGGTFDSENVSVAIFR